jgi:hypothetical protein
MKTTNRTVRLSALILLSTAPFFSGSHAVASEVSVVSGLIKNEKSKSQGKDDGGKSSVEIGARYAQPLSNNMHWFGQAMLAFKSYDGPDGGKSPSNSTSIGLAGGVRVYFSEFSETALPFLSMSGGYLNDTDATNTLETQRSGLYYYGHAGFRFDVDQSFFVELETNLFESALWATKKEKSVQDDTVDRETTNTDLFVSTIGSFNNTTVGAGYKF